jgi:hypothetical protein
MERISNLLIPLYDFQADFAVVLGAGFADPDHAAALANGRVFIEDKFDHLAALNMETSAQPETYFREIEDEAGEPLLVAVQADDQVGAPLRHHSRRLAALGNRKAEHSFTACFNLSFVRNPESECLHPMFDWRIEPDAQKIILAGELLAIHHRALDPKSRRG